MIMKKDIETRFTGWAFVVAAVFLWGGWFLLHHHIGEYFVIEDFAAINENIWYWIWMFRIFIFGWVIMGLAMFALAGITAQKPYRVFTFSGAGIVIVGTFTLALGYAFYYSYGSWGVGEIEGNSPAENEQFLERLMFTNHYVTCLVRFGRIFSGVGLVLLGFALMKWKIVQPWLGGVTLLLGLVAMGIILLIPVNFEIYKPIFHVKVLWLALMGVSILMRGINISEAES